MFRVEDGYLPECSRKDCTIFLDIDSALSGCALQSGCGGVTEGDDNPLIIHIQNSHTLHQET